MANVKKRLENNVVGQFFVDSTCINCDTCRQLAPASFLEKGDYSSVYHQPVSHVEVLQAYQSLLACPVGSIGALDPNGAHMRTAMASFPMQIDGRVYYNGFNSEKSFGANSYYIRHPEGNWLIDSPRYVKRLVDSFEQLGGIRYIFLTHQDDVGDAKRYARHFGATRIIHQADVEAEPEAEWVIKGDGVVRVLPDVLLHPTPGHTPGSMVLLFENRYLFTGDHVFWNRDTQAFTWPRVYLWSPSMIRRSTERLLSYSFEWVLPGHGDRVTLPPRRMKEELRRLLECHPARTQ